MAVTISGMFSDKCFCDSPVIITVNGLTWPAGSPFDTVHVDVMHGGAAVGEYRKDTEGLASATFDISQALRVIWSDYAFAGELKAAAKAAGAPGRDSQTTVNAGYQPEQDADHSSLGTLNCRGYSLRVRTEYLDQASGRFTESLVLSRDGGLCITGGLTEWERYGMKNQGQNAFAWLTGSNRRNGDASTKPTATPERVGRYSLTSWTGLQGQGVRSVFCPDSAAAGDDSTNKHAPIVLRDSQDYADFLFVNRRGAVETCCAMTKEAMDVSQEKKRYSRIEGPVFSPERTVAVTGTRPRHSWQMSSGYQTREWAEWWATEFLASRRHWMRYPVGAEKGTYLPVVIEQAKKGQTVYDRAKQQYQSVEFTVTLLTDG